MRLVSFERWANAPLAGAPWRQFKMCFKSKQLPSLSLFPTHTLSHSLTHSFLALSGRAHLAVVRQSAAINTLTFDMFRCRKCQLQQLTRLSGCTHKVAAGHAPFPLAAPPYYFTCPIWRGTLCNSYVYPSTCSHSRSHLASEAVKFCINWNHLSYLTPPGNPGNTCNSNGQVSPLENGINFFIMSFA